jgi:hypothetical protein
MSNSAIAPILDDSPSFELGICTGSPEVFLGHLCLYPRKTIPGCLGVGNYGHGHGVHSGSRVPEGILGYRILSHVGVQL